VRICISTIRTTVAIYPITPASSTHQQLSWNESINQSNQSKIKWILAKSRKIEELNKYPMNELEFNYQYKDRRNVMFLLHTYSQGNEFSPPHIVVV